MKTLVLLPIAALLSTALGIAPRSGASTDITPPWCVTSYTESCSPGGCIYNFNIDLSDSGTNEPSFSTKCTGNNITPDFQPCEDPSIATREVNGWSNVTLIVQHYYTEGEARYTITGNHTIVEPLRGVVYEFPIVQSEITAVA